MKNARPLLRLAAALVVVSGFALSLPLALAQEEKGGAAAEFRKALENYIKLLDEEAKSEPRGISLYMAIDEINEEIPDLYSLSPDQAESFRKNDFDEEALRAAMKAATADANDLAVIKNRVFLYIDKTNGKEEFRGRELFMRNHLVQRIVRFAHGGLELPDYTSPPEVPAPVMKILRTEYLPNRELQRIFPLRWLDYARPEADLDTIVSLLKHKTGLVALRRTGDRLGMLVWGRSHEERGKVWLEAVEKRGEHYTVILGQSGIGVSSEDPAPLPAVLLDLGTFENPGSRLIKVRWRDYRLPEVERGVDAKGRPVGRTPVVRDHAVGVNSRNHLLKIYAAPPQRAPAKIDDAELQRRVDAADLVFVNERNGSYLYQSPFTYLKGMTHPRVYPAHATLRTKILERPADEWAWVAFLPMSERSPPLLATPEMMARIRGMARPPQKWTTLGEECAVGIRAKKATSKKGEPIGIEIVTKNTGRDMQEKIALSLSGTAYYPMTQFEVTRPDGEKHLLEKMDPKQHSRGFPRTATLKPGEFVAESVSLDQWQRVGDGGEWTFNEPGEYRIRCLFDTERAATLRKEHMRFRRVH